VIPPKDGSPNGHLARTASAKDQIGLERNVPADRLGRRLARIGSTARGLTPLRYRYSLQSGLTDELFQWMACLNEPLRARLLGLVEQQELSVGELSSVLQLPQSTTSRHLKVLSDEAWLSSRRDGTSRLYRLCAEQFSPKQAQLWGLVKTSITSHSVRDSRRLQRVLVQRQAESQAFFASAAAHWDRLRSELFGADLERRFLPALLAPDCTVLDLGCGTGRLAAAFAPFVKRVIGIDASVAMVDAARTHLQDHDNVEVHQAELQQLPVADASVDLALVVLVLHYVASPAAALREVGRVLRPNGRVLLVDMQPHEKDEHPSQMGQLWSGFTREQLSDWMAPNFQNVAYSELEPDPSAKGPALFVCSATVKQAETGVQQ
jgi:ubiquinone/menaquinone biosynthesis C-methylase UbiE